MLYLLIGVGGMAGAYARYHVAGWIYVRTGTDFPWGTLAVNLSGSFVLGLLLPLLELEGPLTASAALVHVGIVGSFTTFSTFAYESVMLLEEGERGRAAWYVAASLGLGLLAIAVGFVIGHWIF